ncbi:HNH endonuclease [Streptomyces sp. S186]|uniref:HNH endonuclease n=1 Tax=Streptomyces sp. S186 TaxID=3434395 RepID=UPI003F67D34D
MANARTINRHHLVYRSEGGTDGKGNLILIHAECHRQHHAGDHSHGPRKIRTVRPAGSA